MTHAIHLYIDDEIFVNLKDCMMSKRVCGALYGELDQFCMLVLRTIEDGKNEISIVPVKKKRKRKKKGK